MPNFARLKAEEVTNTTTSTSLSMWQQHPAPLWTSDGTFTMTWMTPAHFHARSIKHIK